MRIDAQTMIQNLSGVRPKRIASAEEPSGAGVDSVELSTRAADIRTAMEALSGAPELREERVTELSQQLEQGALTLDGKSLAEKLLQKR